MRLVMAFVLSSALLFGCNDDGSAIGEGGAAGEGGDGSQLTTLTVESVADLREFVTPLTLEYRLRCEESPSDWPVDPNTGEPQLVGEFEPAGPGSVNGEPGSLWGASVDARPGPCSVSLFLRDSNGEVLCSHEQEFVVAADAPTEVDIFLGCERF